MLADDEETEEDEEEEEGSDADGGRDREAEAEPEEEEEHGGEARDLGPSSGGRGFMLGADMETPRPAPWELDRVGGLEGGMLGVVCVGQSSGRKEGSGVLQLLSTVWESGEDSLASLEGPVEGGGVWGGDEEGGRTPVEDEEEEEQGAGPAGPL